MSATYIVGDSLEVLRRMPTDSVDLVLTSPPFLALRNYLPEGTPGKEHEMGSEPNPGAFIDALVEVVEELRRVLAPHGSACFELGDTYAGSGGAGGDYGPAGMREGQPVFDGSATRSNRPGQYGTDTGPTRRKMTDAWPADKSLCLIPELFRFTLVYGFNPLTKRTTPRWRARNVVRWCRPNPPVGALGDKFRPGTTDMVIVTGADAAGRGRYFDLEPVRDKSKPPNRTPRNGPKEIANPDRGSDDEGTGDNPAGAPPLDWWEIPTTPYSGAHYAAYPPQLCVRPIQTMSPPKVCTTCGEPSRRILQTAYVDEKGRPAEAERWEAGIAEGKGAFSNKRNSLTAQNTTLGWTDCGHGTWRTGMVLDPFAGSGTTLTVATGHGRDAIGIDLDRRNADLAIQRVGPLFLHEATVDDLWPLPKDEPA